MCVRTGAHWHQRGHQAADAAGCGFPFAWGRHAGIAEVQGQDAQLRPAGKHDTRSERGWDTVYSPRFPKKCCCVGLKEPSGAARTWCSHCNTIDSGSAGLDVEDNNWNKMSTVVL